MEGLLKVEVWTKKYFLAVLLTYFFDSNLASRLHGKLLFELWVRFGEMLSDFFFKITGRVVKY